MERMRDSLIARGGQTKDQRDQRQASISREWIQGKRSPVTGRMSADIRSPSGTVAGLLTHHHHTRS